MQVDFSRHLRWGTIVAIAMLLVMSACGSQETSDWDEPGPKATFESFLMNWFRYDREAAFEMIAPEDRERLAASLEMVDEEIGEETLKAHEMLVAGRVDNPYDLERIEADPELESAPDEGTEVTLTLIYHDGRTGDATMIWGGEQWYVDLPLEESGSDGTSTDVNSLDGTQGESRE